MSDRRVVARLTGIKLPSKPKQFGLFGMYSKKKALKE